MKRKWQRILSWVLTLTMLVGTFQGTGLTVRAAGDDITVSDIVATWAADATTSTAYATLDADDDCNDPVVDTWTVTGADSAVTVVADPDTANYPLRAILTYAIPNKSDISVLGEKTLTLTATYHENGDTTESYSTSTTLSYTVKGAAGEIVGITGTDTAWTLGEYGAWNPTTKELTLVKGGTFPGLTFKAQLLNGEGTGVTTSAVNSGVTWTFAQTGGTDSVDTGITANTEGNATDTLTLAQSDVAEHADRDTITITATSGGVTVPYEIAVLYTDGNTDLHVETETGTYTVADSAEMSWTVEGDNTATADVVEGNTTATLLKYIDGTELDHSIIFKTRRGQSEATVTDVDWYVATAEQYAAIVANYTDVDVAAGASIVASGSPVDLNGLIFNRRADGKIEITGTPDETLTSATDDDGTVTFYLMARSVVSGELTYAQRWGAFPIAIRFNHARPSLSYQNTTDDEERALVDDSGNYSGNTTYREATLTGEAAAFANPDVYEFTDNGKGAIPGYTNEETSTAVNNIKPASFILSDKNNAVDLTGLDFEIVKENVSDPDVFELDKNSVTGLLKGGAVVNKKTIKVGVKTGLEARPDPYVALLVVKGDQLPVNGVIISVLSFKVSPAFVIKVNGEEKKLDAVAANTYDNYPAGYEFEIGTYTANTQVVGGINLEVSSVEGKSVTFEGSTVQYATKQDNLPEGLAIGAANRSTMTFSGYLAPDTWFEDRVADVENFTNTYHYYDDSTGDIVYIIPFAVKDGVVGDPDYVPNKMYYYGKLRVKPAELVIDTKNEDDVFTDKGNNAYELSLTGTAGYKQADKVTTFVITNPGYKDMKVWLKNTDAADNFDVVDPDSANEAGVFETVVAGDDEYVSKVIKAGESIEVSVAPVVDLPADATAYQDEIDLWHIHDDSVTAGDAAEAAKYYAFYLKRISLKYEVIANTAIKILEPKDQSGTQVLSNENGTLVGDLTGATTLAQVNEVLNPAKTNIRVLNVEIGESAVFKFKAEGMKEGISYDLIEESQFTGNEAKVVGLLKADPDRDIKYLATTSELAADGFNFKFDRNGKLETTGADLEAMGKSFIIGVNAKDTATVNPSAAARVFFLVNVTESDKSVKVYDGTKLVRATGTDDTAYGQDPMNAINGDFKTISDTRNAVMKTTDDSIEVVSKEITIKNEGMVDLTNLWYEIEGVKEVGEMGYLDDIGDDPEFNPFVVGGKNKLALAVGETTSFIVDVKASHYNDFTAGSYVVKVRVGADQMITQHFYVKLTVTNDTPGLFSLDKRWDATAVATDYLRNANNAERLSYHTFTEDALDRLNLDAKFAADYEQNNTPGNVNFLAGSQIAVGKVLSGNTALQLYAYDQAGKRIDSGKVRFDWYKTLASDLDIEDLGLTLDTNGLITGTITRPGTYYITVKIQDITDAEHVMTGYEDICVVVPGIADANVYISDIDVENRGAVKDYLVFKGAVQGETLDSSWDKEFYVYNGEVDKPITGIEVDIVDDSSDEAYIGSASHFAYTLEKTELLAGTDKKAKLVISPVGTASAGAYRAKVRVRSNEIAPIEFYVTWIVAAKLSVTTPSGDDTFGRTGQKPNQPKQYEVVLNASGAGIDHDIEGTLLANDGAYYLAYENLNAALGLTAKQAVTWYVRVKNDDQDDTKLISLAQAFNELGINANNVESTEQYPNNSTKYTRQINQFNTLVAGTIKTAIGDDHRLEISNVVNDSTYNMLTSADLTGGGTYQFTAVAEVPEVKMAGGPKTVVIPKQTAEMDITLRIDPSTDVYVLYNEVTAPDNYWGISETETVSEHNTLVGAERVVPEYEKVTKFDFRDLAVGYAPNEVQRRFVVKNEVDSNMLYQIKTLSANKVDPSDAFLLDSFTDPTAVLLPATYYTAASFGTTEDYLQGYPTGILTRGYFDLRLKNNLPAGEYTGWLVIEGSGFETIEIPLTASVSAKNYSITLRDDRIDGEERDSFTFDPVKARATDGETELGSVWAFVNGNQPLNILRTAELKDGEELGEGAVTKLKVRPINSVIYEDKDNVIDNGMIDPAHDVNDPWAWYYDLDAYAAALAEWEEGGQQGDKPVKDEYIVFGDDFADLSIIVNDGKTPSANSVTLRVWYVDKNTETQENYKDITINYVIYDDEVDDTVTVTPAQVDPYIQMGNVEEGYNVAENSVEFTVSVSGDLDPTKALYGLNVTVDQDDVFRIEGVEPDMIMPGEQAKFTLKPLENLPAGSYRPVVTFTAKNLKNPIVRKLIFVVTESENFSTYAVVDDDDLYDAGGIQEGWTLEGGFKTRLENALSDLSQINADNFKVYGNSLDTGFLINLNDNDDDDLDVKVYNNAGILTVTKLPTCNINQYDTVLENTKFETGAQSFRTVSFKVLETVDLGFSNVWKDLVEAKSGGLIVDGVDLGPVDGIVFQTWVRVILGNDEWVFDAQKSPVFRFLVPYKQAFNTAEEKYSYRGVASGLPYMNITAYSEDRCFEGFLFNANKNSLSVTKLTGTTIITDDTLANASWHYHTYAQPLDSMTYVGEGEGVKWTWVGDKENGYTEAYVTLTCVDPNGCPDEKKGEKVLTAVVTPEKMPGTCTKGGYYKYHASVTFDAAKGVGFNNVTYVSENTAKYEGENLDRHKWAFDWTETGVTVYNIEDLNTAYATVKAECVSGNHIVDVDGPNVKTVSCDKVEFYGTRPTCEEPGSGYYHFIFLSSDIPAEDIEKGLNVVSRNAAEVQPLGHKWKVASTDWEGNFDTGATGATMHLECENDAAHKADLTITKDNIDVVSENAASKTYRAIGYKDGQTLTAEITYTAKPDHEHQWTVSFNWITVSYNVADTKVEAVAYCKVGGETVPATDLTLTNKMVGTTIEYTASAKDPDGKVYYSYKNVSKDGVVRDGHAGQVLNGDLVIVGLEEEYPYTGKKITPDFYVMDGDVVLAKGGDYSVKFSNNKAVGEATIEISGKGNYKDKNAVAKFKIYDPFQKAKDEGVTLAAGVKSIAKIQGSFVYNGKAQYPATITVNLNTKPKSSLTLTHEGDGVYTNEGDTTVVISVVNNVNKGTAVVAAVGADGKVKTKTFSIKAAEISSAKVIEGLEAEYSSKGAIPAGLEVNWKNVDEEEVDLIAKQDFTVKYSNNKAVGTGKIKLTGKGNFKGKLESSFAIKPLEVDEIDAVEAFDKVKAGKLKVTVLDKQGFKVPDKKLSVTVLNEEGAAIDGKTKLTAGTKITVVVKSADPASVVIAEDGISKDAVVGTKMASVKVDAKKLTKTYTGEAIELTEEDMGSVIVTYKKTPLVYGEDFVIVGHANNVNKGSMTVTIAGTGEDNGRGVFSGTKTFKVKIVPKSMQ